MAAVVKDSPRSQRKVADKPMNGSCGARNVSPDKKRTVSPEKVPKKVIPVLKREKEIDKGRVQQNGLEDEVLTVDVKSGEKSMQRRGDAGFETFLMTGDMIIRTSSPQKGNKKPDKKDTTPDKSDSPSQIPTCNTAASHSVPESKIPRVKKAGSPKSDLDKVQPSDDKMDTTGRPTSPMENKTLNKSPSDDKSVKKSPSGEKPVENSPSGPETLQTEEKIPSPSPDSNKSSSYNSSPEKKVNGLGNHQDLDKSSSDPNVVNNNEYSDKGEEHVSESKNRSMVVSKSAEKVTLADLQQKNLVVRSSKSHENYLENSDSYLMVDIEIDDKIASSVDALLCDQSTESSLEKIANLDYRSEDHISKSEQSSPERRPTGTDIYNDRVVVPGYVSPDERQLPTTGRSAGFDEHSGAGFALEQELPDESETDSFDEGATGHFGQVRDQHSKHEGGNSPESEENLSDSDSLYHQPTKDVDRPSASRLAKRLYNLDGFKKSDVSRHLSKKNDFAQLVGEEYLKFFDFTDDTLDMALRQFLSKFALTGETQERERILAHFSKRYVECNPNSYASEDACHTLVCAIMLLNTDLHGQNIGRKMTCGEFIENLADLNDGDNFPREVLKAIYNAIKTEPLSWSLDEEEEQNENHAVAAQDKKVMGANPFLEVPDPQKTKEYISGYVMRKCCQDPDGRKTSTAPMGKRSWKMFYATLKDMILYLHKDEHSYKKQAVYQMNNAVRVHHGLAVKATDYTKKQHVLRLKTADWSTYLFQTSDSKELQRWIDTINFVAASLSAPPLPGACGSQRKFQRPLMPSSYTKLNLQEQFNSHEKRVEEIERELKEHRQYPPEKGAKARVIQEYLEKESYQEFELKRFKTYAYLLQSKMTQFPELEPSLVETAIGEVDEPPSPTSSRPPMPDKNSKPVQRSLSDRYDDDIDPRGYRAEETEDTYL